MKDTLTARLKSETAGEHAQAEELLYSEQLFKGTITTAQFAHLLQIHHQFHLAMDAAIEANDDLAAIAPSTRPKSAEVRKDIERLGHTPEPGNPDLLSELSLPQLIGALYVSEGSMLGGAVIAKAVSKMEDPDVRECTHFFTMYGKDLGPMWVAFCSRLNERPSSEWPAIIEGARIAFELYRELYYSTKATQVHG